jgi:starch synthase
MGRAGRARAVRDFSWDTVAEQTLEVYRAVGAG